MGQSKPHTAFEQVLKGLGSASCRAFDSSFFWGKRALKAPPPKTCRQQLTLLGGAFSKEALIKTSTGRDINNTVSLYPLTALALAACGDVGSTALPRLGRPAAPPEKDDPSNPVLEVSGSQTLDLEEGTIGVVGTADTPTGYTVSATDEDGDDGVSFSVSDDRFTIADDGSLNIVAGSSFDFEDEANPEGEITLTITATDDSADTLTDTQDVTITVTDVDLTITGPQTELREGLIVEDTQTGYTVTATDPNSDSVSFSVSDDRFAIVDGALVAVADSIFDFETEPTITLTITATYDNNDTDPAQVTIAVTDLVDFDYDGVAQSLGRVGAVARGGEEAQTPTTAHFKVAAHEPDTATYTADDFTVHEQNAEGVYEESTRFDITYDDDAEAFVLTLLANNALPLSTTEPINVRVEADGAVTTYFQVVTTEDSLREYGLESDPLTGTVMLPGVTSVDDITITDGRAAYDNAFERSDALGKELTLELVSAATGEVRWTYELDHNGAGLNNARDDGLMSEIFALSGGGTTQYVAVNVETLWNIYLANDADGNPNLAEADKDAVNTLAGEVGGTDLIKGFGGDDIINGNGGDDVLIGGAGDDTIDLGTNAAGSSTVIYRFDSDGTTALASDGGDTVSNFELGIDRLMLIDIDTDTASKIIDVDGLIALAKGQGGAHADALNVNLIPNEEEVGEVEQVGDWEGIEFSFQQGASDRVMLRVNFNEDITDAQATERFGGVTGTTYFQGGVSLTRGTLTDDGLDALATFFGENTLLVVDTDLNLDIF